MIKSITSLIGQSEVMTFSGAYLFANGHINVGATLRGLGVIGSLCRFSINYSFLSEDSKEEEKEYHATLSKLITEISQEKTQKNS